ncbi:hypothetical protein DM02DRAFT_632333 [Periconia macrospinosa]|uniref:RRM domain-containing protein n=1 Tax=Periconia macrospinosa TaxID=97972 RepID=A0A2V1DD04_9PLEO|nr:hypothetical protein DM02DRAFT_632333 [Periconia macrospinosa]
MAEKMEGVTGAAPTMDPAKYPVPIETIWIGNLAEWVDIPHQKKLLARIFKVYGPILDIIMKSSLKRKGQAFIVFTSEEYARQAVEEMDEFPLHGKPMKVRLAKSHSDKTVQTKAADMFEEHKRKRLMIKDYKRAEEAAKANANPAAAQKPDHFDPKPNEHLPPNKTLFLTGLPEDVNEDILNDIFENFNGFKDVRYAKFLNVGWVEFENEQFAIAAKEAASTMTVGAAKKPLVISYKRE